MKVSYQHLHRHLKWMTVFAAIVLFLSSFQSDQDPLHKRVFYISLSEIKNGVPVKKVFGDELFFKNGKLYADMFYNKFGFKWMRYRINRDTFFMDSTQTEVRLLDVEAVVTDESNQTLSFTFLTSEWDLEGVVKISRHDKIKKYYNVWGREKGGKPKKEKKRKSNVKFIREYGNEAS